jgi:Sigma-54 interaction domain
MSWRQLTRRQAPRNSDVPCELPVAVSRRCLTHALVVGGTAAWRRQVAQVLHVRSPLQFASLVRIDGSLDDAWLIRALCDRSELGGGMERAAAASTGTLFIDHIEALSPQAQSLLLNAATGDGDRVDGWSWRPGRLIAGTESDPGLAVRRGILSASLYDTLDKIRIERSLMNDVPHRAGWAHPLAQARDRYRIPLRSTFPSPPAESPGRY